MKLNKETQELLIDYILDQKKGKYLDQKYAGFESIIIGLVRDERVTLAKSSEFDIGSYLESFDFVEEGLELDDSVIRYRLNPEEVAKDSDFSIYVRAVINQNQKEINQLNRDIIDLHIQNDKLADMLS